MNDFLNALDDSLAGLPDIQQAFASYQTAAFPARSPQFFALELAGEAGEVANNEKKVWKGKEVPRASIEDETADVFISLMNYANSNGVDLRAAVARKLRTIEERRRIDPR